MITKKLKDFYFEEYTELSPRSQYQFDLVMKAHGRVTLVRDNRGMRILNEDKVYVINK